MEDHARYPYLASGLVFLLSLVFALSSFLSMSFGDVIAGNAFFFGVSGLLFLLSYLVKRFVKPNGKPAYILSLSLSFVSLLPYLVLLSVVYILQGDAAFAGILPKTFLGYLIIPVAIHFLSLVLLVLYPLLPRFPASPNRRLPLYALLIEATLFLTYLVSELLREGELTSHGLFPTRTSLYLTIPYLGFALIGFLLFFLKGKAFSRAFLFLGAIEVLYYAGAVIPLSALETDFFFSDLSGLLFSSSSVISLMLSFIFFFPMGSKEKS